MNKLVSKASAMALATVFAMMPAAGVFAASEDIIDTSRYGSVTLHKYDITAANADGIDTSDWKATGLRDTTAETTMEDYVIQGVEFTYAKVADITTKTEGGKIQIMYQIPAGLETALGLTDTHGDHSHTATELNNAMEALTDGANETAGKNTLERYVETVNGRQTMVTDENGVASADRLPVGLYLFVETAVPANVSVTVKPFFVSVPMTDPNGDYWFYDVNVYPKNQTDIPTLDKLVRQNDDAALYKNETYYDSVTASEGDKLDYIFVTRLPEITSEATYLTQYTFTDRMDKGIAYNRDVTIYFYDNEDDAYANNTENAVKTWDHGSSAFREEYRGSNSEYNEMIVTPTAEGLKTIDPSLSRHWMVVSYSATMNSDSTPVLGDEGNTNEVNLIWKRTNMDHYDMLEDIARVYTYGLNITKIFEDADKAGDFSKVQFVLQNKTNGHYVTAKLASEGLYQITDATKSNNEEGGTKFVPGSDGKLVIEGLEADTYVLTEIHTSDGYSLLKEPITIAINCTDDDFIASETTLYDIKDIESNPHKQAIEINNDRASATVDNSNTNMSADVVRANMTSNNAFVDLSITNVPNFELPMTGGMGTILFTVVGCAALFVGVMLITKKSKKEA